MRSLTIALALWLLAALFLACAPADDWEKWPRRGTTPLASDGCYTDRCLEYREQILIEKMGGGRR